MIRSMKMRRIFHRCEAAGLDRQPQRMHDEHIEMVRDLRLPSAKVSLRIVNMSDLSRRARHDAALGASLGVSGIEAPQGQQPR
jgi:hypothetical protein